MKFFFLILRELLSYLIAVGVLFPFLLIFKLSNLTSFLIMVFVLFNIGSFFNKSLFILISPGIASFSLTAVIFLFGGKNISIEFILLLVKFS